MRGIPLHTQLRYLRAGVPLIVVFLAALHQIALHTILLNIPDPLWHDRIEILIYGLTGSIVTWIGLTWIAAAVARRAEAETQVREAFAKLEFNHQKLLALHDLGEHVASADDEQAVLELAVQAPLKLAGAQASTVVTFKDDGDQLKLDMAWGLSENYIRALRAQLDAGVSAARCRTCTPLKTKASSDCPLFTGMHDHAKAEGIGSLVCLPIAHEHERVGIIAAYFPHADGPAEDQIRLLNILGGTIAASLHSLRMRAQQVSTLHALDRASQNVETINELAAQMLYIAIEGWQAQAGGIFLFDETTQTWMCRARYGLGETLADPRFNLGLRLARQTLATHQPIIFSDLDSPRDHDLLGAAAIPLATEGLTFGAIFLGAKRRRTFTEKHAELLMTMAHQIALAIRHGQLHEQLGRMAVLEERYRLSREIHDGLAQTLSYLGLQAERVESLINGGRSETASQEIGEMRQSIRAAYLDAREAIDGLRLSVESPNSIAKRFAEYIAEFSRQSGIAAQFIATPNDLTVDAGIGLQLLRIVQEALTNIRKHAQAQNVEVQMNVLADELELTITDNGRGFPDSAQSNRVHHGHGLTIMRERAESLHGSLTVATGKGQGTHLVVMIPLKVKTHEKTSEVYKTSEV
ncbi:MAG: GAF domain-containing sensor histidine kinase [Chloroflexi bacterium]|nr:GAF domain-containing sensor histidine kinase [Chloroflexota bacterium]